MVNGCSILSRYRRSSKLREKMNGKNVFWLFNLPPPLSQLSGTYIGGTRYIVHCATPELSCDSPIILTIQTCTNGIKHRWGKITEKSKKKSSKRLSIIYFSITFLFCCFLMFTFRSLPSSSLMCACASSTPPTLVFCFFAAAMFCVLSGFNDFRLSAKMKSTVSHKT